MTRNTNTTNSVSKKIVFTALFAALIAVCGFISIPIPGTPIPIVLQNMLTVLTGLMLGPVWGTASTLLFLVAGALGLPIFAGGTGGIAKLMGPTGGFLYGYALATLVSGIIAQRPVYGKKTPLIRLILATVAGFVIMYIPGVIHFMKVMEKTFVQTMTLCVIPYIPGDIVKMILAFLLAAKLRIVASWYIFTPDEHELEHMAEDNNE
jgi:biotin transport system substrate-specific component